MPPEVSIGEATPEDWPAIWPFLRDIVGAGETFSLLGTLPEGFEHPVEGYVGLHIMHRRLG